MINDMEKKKYIKPQCTVYPIKPYQLLAGSPGPMDQPDPRMLPPGLPSGFPF
jgi:hypothetical protein